jgi:uncharacterized protein YcfL
MKNILIHLSILLIAACGAKKENPVIAEAAAVHEEAMLLFHELEDLLKELEQYENIEAEAIASIKLALQGWEENLVEVPGYAHAHDHDAHGQHHHHHHDHKKLKISADEMLALQIELRDNIKQLLADAKNFLQE